MGSCHWKATWKDTQGSSAVDHMALLGTTAQVRTFQSIFSLFGISVLPFLFLSFLSFLFCFSFFLPSFHSFSFFLSFLKQRNSLPCLGSVEWLINQCVYQCSTTCVGDFHVPVTFSFFSCRNPECRMLASASKVHLYTKMWSKWS